MTSPPPSPSPLEREGWGVDIYIAFDEYLGQGKSTLTLMTKQKATHDITSRIRFGIRTDGDTCEKWFTGGKVWRELWQRSLRFFAARISSRTIGSGVIVVINATELSISEN